MIALAEIIVLLPSRPAWGAWIEICSSTIWVMLFRSRAPHGARGLKFFSPLSRVLFPVVAPRMGRVD